MKLWEMTYSGVFLSFIFLSRLEWTLANTKGLINLPLQRFKTNEADIENRYGHYFPIDVTKEHENVRGGRKLMSDEHGTHFATIFVGNPAQPQVLAVSTDSDYTAFPCVEKKGQKIASSKTDSEYTFVYSDSDTFEAVICGECYNEDKVCDSKKSSCVVSAEYRDLSSWKAFEAKDNVYVGGAQVEGPLKGTDVAKKYGFQFMFACQTDVVGWKYGDLADGTMGFSSKQTSFINQMYEAKVLKRPAFSLCFGHKIDNADGTTEGSLTLGGFNPKFHASGMVFAKNTMAKNNFSIYLRNMFLRKGGGDSVKPVIAGMKVIKIDFDDEFINSDQGGGVAFDSSTPYTLFSRELSEPFKQAWKMATDEDFSYRKVKLTESQVRSLPTIILQFQAYQGPNKLKNRENLFLANELDKDNPDDILVAFPASHYMEYNSNTRMYRPRISFENMEGSVIGANMMQGHDVTFDLIKDRIGFAEALTCIFDGEYGSEYDTGPGGFTYTNTDDLFNGEIDDAMIVPKDNWGADDAFMTDDASFGARKKKVEKFINAKGSCDTMLCKAFVGVGYFFSVVFAWVIFKCVNVKARVTEAYGTQEDIEDLQEVDFPDYDPEPETEEYDSHVDTQPLAANYH